eukprot:m.34158 g.34158  ORF g.34158 m.34158 type:complete len:94 (+) comp9909_c1_seq1:1205-1486(+)
MSSQSSTVYQQKWDRCLSKSIQYTGAGFGFGVLFSLVMFRRKAWPLAMGTGFGAGMAYSSCQFDFLHPDLIHGKIIAKSSVSQEEKPKQESNE